MITVSSAESLVDVVARGLVLVGERLRFLGGERDAAVIGAVVERVWPGIGGFGALVDGGKTTWYGVVLRAVAWEWKRRRELGEDLDPLAVAVNAYRTMEVYAPLQDLWAQGALCPPPASTAGLVAALEQLGLARENANRLAHFVAAAVAMKEGA